VQRERRALWQAQGWARQAQSDAVRALWVSGIALLPAAIALLTG
jgi:hypothetical protein